MARLISGLCAVMLTLAAAPVFAQTQEKVEINVVNNRDEAITMHFDYAFRDYNWNLMQHTLEAGADVIYRFPANIPGCERLRDWHITDGVLTITNARGALCAKRISLCDKFAMTMAVNMAQCNWSVGS